MTQSRTNGNVVSESHDGALNYQEVSAILIQRFPLMMVDRVCKCEPGVSLTSIKNVSGNDIHFVGHFPGRAIFPGVLIIEAMAQSLHILDVLSAAPSVDAGLTYLGNASVRFCHTVVPGDQMVIKVDLVKRSVTGVIGNVVVSVDTTVVAKGELILGRKTASDGAS